MKIAILSNGNANYSTKRLVAEAEQRGHTVRVIKYKNCYLSLDEKHPRVYYHGKILSGFDAIIPRISNNMGLKYDPSNYLLMHAMGPNVAGVIGSAIAAGILLGFLV